MSGRRPDAQRVPLQPRPPDPGGDPEEIPEWTDRALDGADLANLDRHRAGLLRCTFSGCRLTGLRAGEAQLQDVAFTGCRIDLAGLRFATLERVGFTDCDLRELDLAEARLQDVTFTGCDLTRADFSAARCRRVLLEGCRVDGLRGTDGLRGALLGWEDVLALAPSLAADAGLVLRED